MRGELARAAVFVFPSRQEGFALAEAMTLVVGDLDTLGVMRRRGREHIELEHVPAVFGHVLASALEEDDGA